MNEEFLLPLSHCISEACAVLFKVLYSCGWCLSPRIADLNNPLRILFFKCGNKGALSRSSDAVLVMAHGIHHSTVSVGE